MKTENSSEYFCNSACAYFPCHPGADPEHFNCLFCYCPLYALGSSCGGSFRYLDSGIKDCSHCLLPHSRGGYEIIIGKFKQLAELAKEK